VEGSVRKLPLDIELSVRILEHPLQDNVNGVKDGALCVKIDPEIFPKMYVPAEEDDDRFEEPPRDATCGRFGVGSCTTRTPPQRLGRSMQGFQALRRILNMNTLDR
jgi:hypothetical protein